MHTEVKTNMTNLWPTYDQLMTNYDQLWPTMHTEVKTNMTNLWPTSTQGEGPADDLSNMKKDLAEARERIAKTEQEKDDLRRKTEELEKGLVEIKTERDEVELKAKEGKANETKKLLSSVTKLLLSSFPADQVFALDIV